MPGRIRGSDTRVVEEAGVKILVSESVHEVDGKERYVAELSVAGTDVDRAVVEATNPEEYQRLLAAALRGFAASVRLRLDA